MLDMLKIKIFSSILLCLAFLNLNACSTVGDKVFGRKEVPQVEQQRIQDQAPGNLSRYEWAIQHYETGHYENTIEGLQFYRDKGAATPGFPLVPYYLGMSHFQLGQCDQAMPFLKDFVTANPGLSQSQEARITLLQCHENKKEWQQIVTRAAESEKYPLYAEDRIRLKLIWTRALFELREVSGAKQSLQETESLVNNFTRDPDHLPELSQSNEDFLARQFHLRTMFELQDCDSIASPKRSSAANQILIDRWIEAKGDCLLTATNKALDLGLGFTGEQADRWIGSLSDYFTRFTEAPIEAAKDKLYPNLRDAQMAMRPKLRAALYRIVATVDQRLQHKDATPQIRLALEKLQKSLENLLLQLSLLS
jgi:hypothetical protein